MEKHPEHKAGFKELTERYIVKVGDSVIVDTTNAIQLTESSHRGVYPPVLYFPFNDTAKEYLVPSDLHTFCPLKGEASYYDLVVGDKTLENAVWYYPQPLEYVPELKGYLSFYTDKVKIETTGD